MTETPDDVENPSSTSKHDEFNTSQQQGNHLSRMTKNLEIPGDVVNRSSTRDDDGGASSDVREFNTSQQQGNHLSRMTKNVEIPGDVVNRSSTRDDDGGASSDVREIIRSLQEANAIVCCCQFTELESSDLKIKTATKIINDIILVETFYKSPRTSEWTLMLRQQVCLEYNKISEILKEAGQKDGLRSPSFHLYPNRLPVRLPSDTRGLWRFFLKKIVRDEKQHAVAALFINGCKEIISEKFRISKQYIETSEGKIAFNEHSEEALIKWIDNTLIQCSQKLNIAQRGGYILIYTFNSPCVKRENDNLTPCYFLIKKYSDEWQTNYSLSTDVGFSNIFGPISISKVRLYIQLSKISSSGSIFYKYKDKKDWQDNIQRNLNEVFVYFFIKYPKLIWREKCSVNFHLIDKNTLLKESISHNFGLSSLSFNLHLKKIGVWSRVYLASRPMIDEMGSSPPLTQKILCLIPYFHNSNQSDKLKIGFMKYSIFKKVLYEIPHTDWIQTILDNIIASFSMKYPKLIPGSNCLLKFKLIEINTETKEYTIIIIIHHFNGFFFNLAQQQSGDLAMVYPPFHHMIAQIGSSPPHDPDNLYIFILQCKPVKYSVLFAILLKLGNKKLPIL
ncbi:unnamed protein product [Oreochromis niloticus]|nr:unnamed protein product [Mustela putorius furo]